MVEPVTPFFFPRREAFLPFLLAAELRKNERGTRGGFGGEHAIGPPPPSGGGAALFLFAR